MKLYTRVVLILLFGALASCATTGGDIGGLFPSPKFLKGIIKGDIYTTNDGSLSVAVPHKEGSYEYTYMQVKEQYSPLGDYISFGPAALDKSIYRVETGKRVSPNSAVTGIEEIASKIVEGYKTQLTQSYGTTPEQLSSSVETINGRRAYYWHFRQTVPPGKYISNSNATFSHHVYVLDMEQGPAIAWVQLPPERVTRPALAHRAFAQSIARR